MPSLAHRGTVRPPTRISSTTPSRAPHVGLRTFDGTTRAAGFFPACPFAFGYKIQNDPSGDYWKDYARGAGKPTYWRNWPQYSLTWPSATTGRGR